LNFPVRLKTDQSFIKSTTLTLLFTSLALLSFQPLAHSQGVGYWHTNGSQILDANGDSVRIAGINWYGFETTDEVAHGLYTQDYHEILTTIKAQGYNTIRLPFSNQMVESPIVPAAVSSANGSGPINTDLAGLSSIEIMDKIITAAGADGLKVILDNHRSEAGNSNESNGLWYTSAYPESSWIADWQTMATRYKNFKDVNGNPIVIGMDLRNEPYTMFGGSATGSCWTGDTTTGGCPTSNTAHNWPAAAGRAATAVLNINPSLLIFIEGVDCYSGNCDWQGGNLAGAGQYPVTLPVAGRLVYSAHDYGPDLYQQPWFNGSTTSASLQAVWTKDWAYLSIDNTAPVWVGEFGTTNVNTDIENNAAGSQGQWFSALINFLGNEPAINWTYWALNGEDSFGLLDSNYDATPVSATKQQQLESIQFPLVGLGGSNGSNSPVCSASPATPAKLAASSASDSSIQLSWGAVTAPANCSVTYSVFRGTTKGFTASSSNQVASGLPSAAFANSGLNASTAYYYAVEAVDAHGSSAASAQASATTAAVPVCSASPATPVSLEASSVSPSEIQLSWGAVTPPANCSVTYTVYRGTAKGFAPASSNQVATGLTTGGFADSSLKASTAYYYAVKAVDAHGSSSASAQASATTEAAAPQGAACHVSYSIAGSWGTGFEALLVIENTGTTSLTNWTLEWTFPDNQVITDLWVGVESQSGEKVTVSNESYNGTVAAGGSVQGVGFVGSYSGTNSVPTNFTLNGVACK
jgi:endoglucanase